MRLVISAIGNPPSACFKAKAICSSVNLLFFIEKSPFSSFYNEIFRIFFGSEFGENVNTYNFHISISEI